VVYQIYPRSFADADGDGIGDLRGIASRVGYLTELGIDAVWMSPFYPSALADGGYDVDDYRDVDPRLGTLRDFDDLVSRLHEAGIRVIIDIVPNHSSNRHAWFQEALGSPKGSRARDRDIFRDGRGELGDEPPSDWVSNFGGSAWTRALDGQWYLHLFSAEQPDFNWDNREVRDDFLTTLRFWADRGVDGFRVDVAHALAKDLSTPLRSKTTGLFDIAPDGTDPLYDRDDVHRIFEEWREVLNRYDPPKAAIAEAWVPAHRRPLYARSTELGQAFNFDLLKAPWDAQAFQEVIAKNLAEAAVSGTSSTWVLSNHDVIRHASRYGLPEVDDGERWLSSGGVEPIEQRSLGLDRARAATLLILALPGSAYLYQGEELGLFEVADLPDSVLQDPIWVRTHGALKGRDGCRVPLPWTRDGISFGFGRGSSHLPQPHWFRERSVEMQSERADSTLSLYRRAIRLRAQLSGPEELEWIGAGGPDVVRFERPGGWQSITNFGEAPVVLPSGSVALASGPLGEDSLPGNTTVWIQT
jgi:alpha-glucosidase